MKMLTQKIMIFMTFFCVLNFVVAMNTDNRGRTLEREEQLSATFKEECDVKRREDSSFRAYKRLKRYNIGACPNRPNTSTPESITEGEGPSTSTPE